MTWNDKQAILKRKGHGNFSSEEEYNEWFSELDRVQQQPIIKALCDDEYRLPSFDWSRRYFQTAKTKLYGKEPINY